MVSQRVLAVAEKLGVSVGLNGTEPARQRPRIEVKDRFLRDITEDALAALAASNDPPRLFQRGRTLVRVSDDGLLCDPLDAVALKGELDRVADFVELRLTKDGEIREVPKRPPADLAPNILALPAWPFPPLRGMASAPVFLPGGRLLATDGYDQESGMLVRLGALTECRGAMDPAEALRWLADELLSDFPFADEAGRAHALAAVLERFVRPLIDGATPLYLIDAPTPGTGKGLLADVLSLVPTGEPAAVMSLVRDEDEVEKRITALLLRGAPAILLDNVTELRSASLAAALTSTTWRGRRLGKSEMVDVPNSATWLATGNNVALSDELARRVVPIRLDAGVERPEERRGFRHPDLVRWARTHRPQLVEACLSLVRAWIDAGMPSGAATLGRFEAWAEVLGGILSVAGVPGFLGGRERLRAEADRDTREWAAVCAAWWEAHRDHPVTARDVFAICKERRLLLDVWGGRSELSAQQRLGHALASRRDRIFAGYTIRSAGRDGKTGNAAYSLERRGPETPETPETPEAPADFVETTRDSAVGVFGVFPREEPKHRQNTGGENPRSDAEFDASSGVSGVSGVFSRGHSRPAGDAVPGGEERQRPDGKTPETPETPELRPTCQAPLACSKLGRCDGWCADDADDPAGGAIPAGFAPPEGEL